MFLFALRTPITLLCKPHCIIQLHSICVVENIMIQFEKYTFEKNTVKYDLTTQVQGLKGNFSDDT